MDALPKDPGSHPLGQVTSSARGWHGVQLAVLAFIGLCGVLSEPDPGTPRGLQVASGLLALLALALGCLATFVVARVAWPLGVTPSGPPDTEAAALRLRIGVTLTFAAVVVMALAASVGWWPADEEDADGAGGTAVEVTDQTGGTACGTLVDAPRGAVRLATDRGTVDVAAERLAAVTPVDGC